MKVLHLLNDVTDRGNGIVNTAVDLALEQSREGMTVAVLSAGGGYRPVLERAGVLHLTLDQTRRPGKMLQALAHFHRYIRDFRPDVVHAHMRTGLLLAWLWKHFNRYVLIGHVHNVHDRESVLMGLADRVLAVSSSVAETMAGSGIPRRKIRVVVNRTLGSQRQLNLDEIAPASIARPSIVTVGGMNYRKGIEELITAFEMVGKKFADAHLYLVGDGPQRALFERQAAQCAAHERIHFEGFQAVPQAYMRSADVFVLASRRESFGLVLIEAREAGCAIVATSVDGVPEALDGGQAGVLIPPRNAEALADALSRMLGNEAERAEWQRRARSGVANYRVPLMAAEVKAVYNELLEAAGWRVASDAA